MKSTFQKLLEAGRGLGIAVFLAVCFGLVWAAVFAALSGLCALLNEVSPMWSYASFCSALASGITPHIRVVALVIAGVVTLRLLAGVDALPALSRLLSTLSSKLTSRPESRPTSNVSGQPGRPNGHNPSHQNDGNRGQNRPVAAGAAPAQAPKAEAEKK